MSKNPELELAVQFIEKTDRNLFITGKAGTGKTTFLHKIKNECIVTPFALIAATPVGATITILFKDSLLILCKKVVFPVPAFPVIKRFLSVFSMNCNASSNSGFFGI